MNTYSSIEPNQMSNSEIRNMCAELQTAINWGLLAAKVKTRCGTVHSVKVSKIKDFQDAYVAEAGSFN